MIVVYIFFLDEFFFVIFIRVLYKIIFFGEKESKKFKRLRFSYIKRDSRYGRKRFVLIRVGFYIDSIFMSRV